MEKKEKNAKNDNNNKMRRTVRNKEYFDSSKKIYDYGDYIYNKNRRYSDKRVVKMDFLENRRKTMRVPNKNKKINENILKPKIYISSKTNANKNLIEKKLNISSKIKSNKNINDSILKKKGNVINKINDNNSKKISKNISSKKVDNNINYITFSCIKEEDIYKWKEILYNHNQAFGIIQLNENIDNNEDNKILTKYKDVEKNAKNPDDYDVLQKDAIRTRVNETKSMKDFVQTLEILIKFFINENKVEYKQGLNEMIGAFLILKYSNVKKDMTLSEVYNLLNGFINLFAFNYYYDESVYSMKNSFGLLTLLIKYHDPEIYNAFEKASICPEMYATSWLLTVFAYKLQLDILFYLWNKLILENDELMIYYIIVALLINRKSIFIDANIGSLPILLNKISIDTEKDVDIIFESALNLRKKTPYSFRLFAKKLEIIQHKSNQHKDKFNLYHPNTLISIPIFPSEIYYICYKDIIKCPDENHNYCMNIKADCEHCDMKIEKDINYIILDLRISDKGFFVTSNEKSGFLPHLTVIDDKDINNNDLLNAIDNRFKDLKNKYHFIFMTSKSECINESEKDPFVDFKDDNPDNSDIKSDSKSARTTKAIKLEKKNKKLTHEEKNIIKETDNLKKIISYLVSNGYPYVSYIYGGFETIHNEIMNSQGNEGNIYSEISLLNHSDAKCALCKNNKKLLKKSLSPDSKTYPIKTKTFMKSLSPKNLGGFFKKNESKSIEVESKPSYRNISLDEVNKMISETKYFAAPCNFIIDNKNKKSMKKNSVGNVYDNQGMLIIYEKKIFAIKTSIYEHRPMEIINEIPLDSLKDFKIKCKLFAHINFVNKEKNNKKEFLIVRFNYEQDSKKFIDSLNKVLKEH